MAFKTAKIARVTLGGNWNTVTLRFAEDYLNVTHVVWCAPDGWSEIEHHVDMTKPVWGSWEEDFSWLWAT